MEDEPGDEKDVTTSRPRLKGLEHGGAFLGLASLQSYSVLIERESVCVGMCVGGSC